jgi:hypothetical protein
MITFDPATYFNGLPILPLNTDLKRKAVLKLRKK